ncbi:MAG: TPM domain-containing protein [Candidatus Cybelea sp.]
MIATLLLAASFTIPPTPDHYVTDNVGALSQSARISIENELRAYEKATGHQIIVYIDQTTGDVPLETWTGDTAHTWKIGRREHDDGAILFLFMRDHRIRIEVGYGLESKLTDADAHRIITDDITPKMKAADPDGAVSSGVADMLTTVEPSYKVSQLLTPAVSESSPGEITITNPVVAVAIAIAALLFLLFCIFVVVSPIVGAIRYGYLVMREGPTAAKKDMRHWWSFSVGSGGGDGGGSFGGSGGGSFGDGGDFGGGGASGSW